MAYSHSGKKPVTLSGDPADPDGTDWLYISYAGWLRTGETITAHEAEVINGTMDTDSTYIGDMTDSDGIEYAEVYAVQFTPAQDAASVSIRHRVSTTTTGATLGRSSMDHTFTIPVKQL